MDTERIYAKIQHSLMRKVLSVTIKKVPFKTEKITHESVYIKFSI